MYKKVNAWCNDPLDEPRDPRAVAQRFRNDEDMQPGIGRISRGEHQAYRKRTLCYNNDRRPASWRTRLACADRGVAFVPSCHTCSRSTRARSRMFPCVSANTRTRFFRTSGKKKFERGKLLEELYFGMQ